METYHVNDAASLKRRHAQQGASALEFALVFPLFFLILYMAIAYGLIFAAQQSMNYAAETMARDALLLGQSDADSTRSVNWLRSLGGEGALDIQEQNSLVSGREYEKQVVIRYDYHNHPLVPWLGPRFLSAMVFPDELVATATVDRQITGLVRP